MFQQDGSRRDHGVVLNCNKMRMNVPDNAKITHLHVLPQFHASQPVKEAPELGMRREPGWKEKGNRPHSLEQISAGHVGGVNHNEFSFLCSIP
jgi:hypothetical protein